MRASSAVLASSRVLTPCQKSLGSDNVNGLIYQVLPERVEYGNVPACCRCMCTQSLLDCQLPGFNRLEESRLRRAGALGVTVEGQALVFILQWTVTNVDFEFLPHIWAGRPRTQNNTALGNFVLSHGPGAQPVKTG